MMVMVSVRDVLSHTLLGLTLLPVARATSPSCTTCRGPVHSWDHIPLSFHWSSAQTDSTGEFSAEDLETIVKFPLVTIEKWQGSAAPEFLWEETAWAAAAKQIKLASPNTSVAVWMDTMLIYTGPYVCVVMLVVFIFCAACALMKGIS